VSGPGWLLLPLPSSAGKQLSLLLVLLLGPEVLWLEFERQEFAFGIVI
jgi:hypothetical protein